MSSSLPFISFALGDLWEQFSYFKFHFQSFNEELPRNVFQFFHCYILLPTEDTVPKCQMNFFSIEYTDFIPHRGLRFHSKFLLAEYGNKMLLMVKLQFWNSGDCGVPIQLQLLQLPMRSYASLFGQKYLIAFIHIP